MNKLIIFGILIGSLLISGAILHQFDLIYLIGFAVSVVFITYFRNKPGPVLALNLVGFPIYLYALELLGLEFTQSPMKTLVFYGGIVICYGLAIITQSTHNKKFVHGLFESPNVLFFLFVFWGVVVWIFHGSSMSGAKDVGYIFMVAIPSYLGPQVLGKKQLKAFINTTIFLVIVLDIISLYEYFTNTNMLRFSISSSINPIFLAFSYSAGILFLINVAFLQKRQSIFGLFMGIFAFINLILILSTGTRASFLGLMVSIIIVLLLYEKKIGRHFIFLLVLGIPLLLFAQDLVPDFALMRYQNLIESIIINPNNFFQGKHIADEVLAGRIWVWRQAIEVLYQNPFWGIGFGGFENITNQLFAQHAHNFLLDIFISTGLIGGIIFSVFLILVIRRILPLIRFNLLLNRITVGLFLLSIIKVSFSGQIQGVSDFWISVGLVTAISLENNKVNRYPILDNNSN